MPKTIEQKVADKILSEISHLTPNIRQTWLFVVVRDDTLRIVDTNTLWVGDIVVLTLSPYTTAMPAIDDIFRCVSRLKNLISLPPLLQKGK